MSTLSLPVDTSSDRLLTHWDALIAEYAVIIKALAIVTHQIEET